MGNTLPKVSVVVPVWNAEAYLARCVDSILGQTLTDIEAVLVDDGSTDGSGAMIDDYAARDPRVVAIHTGNRGPADARHTGVHAASGEYITFYDSDDYAPADALERFYAKARETEADLVLGDYWTNHHRGSLEFFRIRQPESNEKESFTFLRLWLEGNLRGALWVLLFRRTLFTSAVRDYLATKFGEDTIMLVQLLSRAEKIVQIPESVYCYVLRQGSLCRYGEPWSPMQFDDHVQSRRFILDYLERIPGRVVFADELAYWVLCQLSLQQIKRISGGVNFSDFESRVYRDYFPNRTARRRLRKRWPKQYVFLMAERHTGWRLVKKALWGTPLMRRVVRTIHKTFRKQP